MRKTPNQELGRPTEQEYRGMKKMTVAVVLDNVRSLNNVGSVFRTCDAFAVKKIMLCGITGTPPDREIHKTALSAESTVPWEYFPDTPSALSALIDEGYEPVAVEQADEAEMLEDFRCEPGHKYALVFGNEVNGVSQQAADMCRRAIEIPQAGTKHSLNVSVSAGVVLWHFFERLYLGK